MNTKSVADRIGISSATLRLWTTSDYREYFSKSAQGDGTRRVWTEHDVQVAAMIVELKQAGMGGDDIRATLASMKEGEWKGLPDVPSELPSVQAMQEIADTRLNEREKALRSQIALLAGEVDELRGALDAERETSTALREQLTSKEREWGEALGQLKALTGERRSVVFWLAVIAGVVVFVVVLAGVDVFVRTGG